MRPLTRAEHPEAIELLAAAFDGDPMFRFLLPDERRGASLRFFMGAMLAQSAPDGHVYTKDGLPGVIALVAPGRWPPPSARLAGYLLRFWSRPGLPWPRWSESRRGLAVLELMERLHPKDPHWYVEVLGVSPAHQGKGVGRALLSHACGLADAAGLPAYLETTNPVNLPIYRRAGFEVVDEVSLPGGFPPLWTMRRPARGTPENR